MVGELPKSNHVRLVPLSNLSILRNLSDAPISLEPSATVFHYAQALFEGLKAYRDSKGRVTLFRPDMNMKRMNTSAKRIALPVGACFILLHKVLLMASKCADFRRRSVTGAYQDTHPHGQALDPA